MQFKYFTHSFFLLFYAENFIEIVRHLLREDQRFFQPSTDFTNSLAENRKSCKVGPPDHGERRFSFLGSSQVEHLAILEGLGSQSKYLNYHLESDVRQPQVDALRPCPFPFVHNHCGQRMNSPRVYF